MSEISVKHPKSYREKSRIQEETQITLSYLSDLSGWLNGTIEIVRHADVSNFGVNAEQIPILYALESPALKEALDEVRGTARVLREVLEERWPSEGKQSARRRPIPEREADDSGPSHSEPWPGRLYVLDQVLPIHKGLLERFRRVPIIARTDSDALALYIDIEGIKDVLVRDIHDGWHYHYCKPDGRRSDTLLAFDALHSAPTKPLFWERHGEGKAAFYAQAGGWGSHKRKSVYAACEPDVRKRRPNEFRRPQRSAEPVWPLGAILSAQVAPASVAKKK